MSKKKKSPIDQLFFELYGYYPPKAGQAYEMIVSATLKLLHDKDVEYDQRIRGDYSDTVYQLDGLIHDLDGQRMVEAKDYTIYNKKVGRGDLQKLQGALTDLNVSNGLFASATDFTKPATKYADSASNNPNQKPIELFHIRPSTEADEKGRIKKITFEISAHVPEYDKGKYQPILTKAGAEKAVGDGLADKTVSMSIDRFYDKNGNTLTTIHDLTKYHSPGTTWEKDFISKGCWIIDGYMDFDGTMYELKGLYYEIPFSVSIDHMVVEGGGTPKVYIKSQSGTIDKLVSDEELKKIRFENGKVIKR